MEGIAPLAINRVAKPIAGTVGTIVGFGRIGGSSRNAGIKRIGNVRTSNCNGPLSDTNLVCWKYDALVKTPGENSNTCIGDSGGGLQVGREQIIAGVTSGGTKADCLAGDYAYDADVFQYYRWIDSVASLQSEANSCGPFPSIDVERHVLGEIETLDSSKDQLKYEVPVSANTARLRVAMNSEDDGHSHNDFDLYVIPGVKPDLRLAACVQNDPGQFGFCEIVDPSPGTWTILLNRKSGEGLVQTVVTLVQRPPAR